MLAIDSLTVRYPDRPVPAVDGVSAVIESSACILGPSGCGKSAFLRSLIAMNPHAHGRIFAEGLEVTRRPLTARRIFSYMAQNTGLPRESTLREYLSELALFDGYAPNDRSGAVDRVLAQVHLGEAGAQRLKWLSGGMRRRALLAATLLRDTPWLLLDEPTLGLDPDEQASVRALIRDLSLERRIIIATRVVDDANAVPHRLLVMHRGRLMADTRWRELSEWAEGHVFVQPFSEAAAAPGALWAPRAGTTRIKVFVDGDSPTRGEALSPTPEDGYLWLLRTKGVERS